MKRLKSDDETLDRLNELPDSLILKILSFLEMRDVVRTSLVSKRWKDLWTTISYLDFDEYGKNSVQTRNFINGVLLRWKGTEILKFKIRFEKVYDASLSGDMDFWVGFAAERKVEELYLGLPYDYRKPPPPPSPPPLPSESDPVHLPPQCLYSCSSITKLCLIGYCIQFDRGNGNVPWDQLKSLTIHGYCISEDLINQLVSSTPQLEILDAVLSGNRQKSSIRSSSLKRLTLVTLSRYGDENDPSNYTALTIWAPNLEALAISGPTYSTCLLLNVPSLTDVTLDFYDNCDVRVGETLKQVLPAIQHVEALKLSLCCFKMLGVMKAKYSFSNVKRLKFIGGLIEPYDIVGLVEFFSKVEKLVIDWKRNLWSRLFIANLSQKHDFGENYLESEANNLKSFLMQQLRTVEVTWYSHETASMFQFIKFLLKHATMLQKMVIKKGGNGVVKSEDMVLAAQELLSLQRSFPTLDLIFCKK